MEIRPSQTRRLAPSPIHKIASCLAPFIGGLILLFSSGSSLAQCAHTLSTRTYDTLLTGSGFGTYTVNFPKFNADSGILISVKVSATVKLKYGFTLRNADINPSTYTLIVGREDQISGGAMTPSYDNIMEQHIGSFLLNPGDQVSQPFAEVLNNYVDTDSITGAVSNFVGTGRMSLTYASTTYADIHTSNNASYAYSASAQDSVHFSVSYLFCTATILPVSLLSFTATLQDPSNHRDGEDSIALAWTVADDRPGHIYEVQQSDNGSDFVTLSSIPSLASFGATAYNSSIPVPSTNKIFFRLKMTDEHGKVSYSEVRVVDLGSSGMNGLSLYPNPASDHITIHFGPSSAAASLSTVAPPTSSPTGDWQIAIYSPDGQLIQKEFFSSTNSARLTFSRVLSPGVYFIRTLDHKSNRSLAASFLVR